MIFGRLLNYRPRGDYRVTGILTVNGLPSSRLVRLFEFPSLRLIDAAWSNATTGVYVFNNVPQRPSGGATYGVLGYDHTGQYDPEAKVQLIAEPMP
jgi:hypothetical protein